MWTAGRAFTDQAGFIDSSLTVIFGRRVPKPLIWLVSLSRLRTGVDPSMPSMSSKTWVFPPPGW
eukprot:scaffold23463_cov59-Phaeocystis_antarctica.AAC.9